MKEKLRWIDYLKIVVFGIVFALIAYIISGDMSSISLGLLLMYLEYRFMKMR